MRDRDDDHNHDRERQILLDEDGREPERALLQSVCLVLLELIQVAELSLVGGVKLPGVRRRNSRSGRGNCDTKAASLSEATRVLADLNCGSPAGD